MLPSIVSVLILSIGVYACEPEIINRHILPPEPGPKVNNATILGIDSNNNGVRDDVERKILTTYTKPIHAELMLFKARAYQEMLNDPVICHSLSKENTTSR